jgi:hypothetical protein
MLEPVTALNKQITELAPVLNSPTVPDGAKVNAADSIALMVKKHGGNTWLFAANLSNQPQKAGFAVNGFNTATVEVTGESRGINLQKGAFSDDFGGYAVHLYRLKNP